MCSNQNFYEDDEEIYFVELSKGIHSPKKIVSKLQNTYNEIRRAFEVNKLFHPLAKLVYVGKADRRKLQLLDKENINVHNGLRPIKVKQDSYCHINEI